MCFVQFVIGQSGEALLKMLEGQNQRKIAQKRIRFEEMMEKGEEDGLSALPDCLLVEILSHLPSTEDAIRTSTLSKRWQHLWASVHTLIFKQSPQCYQNPNLRSDFPSSVDKTLTQCRQLKLKKFEVHTFYDIRFESQFNNWIRYAISCNVEELHLKCLGMQAESFLLDQDVFINSCFTDLSFTGCKLNPTRAISWKNLRTLCFCRVNVDEDLIVNILSGSPLLETLAMEYCYCSRQGITSDDDDDDEGDYMMTSDDESEADDIIEVGAPTSSLLTQCPQLKQLKKFRVYTRYDIQFQSLLNNWIRYAIRCNIQELNLWFLNNEYQDGFKLDQILFTSSCFTELTLHGCMFNPVGAISWKNLRSLCISGYQSLDEDLIENVLSGSPVLETLVLRRCYGYRRLDITSKSVKNLVLCGYEVPYGESETDIIEIDAPNILSLGIQGGTFLCKPLLLNVSSVVTAYLNYTSTKPEHRKTTTPKEAEQEMLKACILNLRHVKLLELGFLCSKVLSCLQAKGFVSPSNVKLNNGVY